MNRVEALFVCRLLLLQLIIAGCATSDARLGTTETAIVESKIEDSATPTSTSAEPTPLVSQSDAEVPIAIEPLLAPREYPQQQRRILVNRLPLPPEPAVERRIDRIDDAPKVLLIGRPASPEPDRLAATFTLLPHPKAPQRILSYRSLVAAPEQGTATAREPTQQPKAQANPEVAEPVPTEANVPATRPAYNDLPSAAIRLSRTGITVPVSLDGFGWIYIPDVAAAGYSYAGRQLTENGSIFNFKIDSPGDYQLRFQRQNPARGTFERALVELLGRDAIHLPIASTSDVESASEESETPLPAVTPEYASDLASKGDYRGALSAYRRLIREGRADLAADAGAVAMKAFDYDEAVLHFASAVADPARSDPYRDALLLLDAADRAISTEPVAAVVDILSDPKVLAHREDLDRLRILLQNNGHYPAEMAVLHEILDRYSGSPANDKVYFRMARIYETEGEPRDERRAFELYKELIDRFPLSAWYEEAQSRMLHLERHYLNIR